MAALGPCFENAAPSADGRGRRWIDSSEVEEDRCTSGRWKPLRPNRVVIGSSGSAASPCYATGRVPHEQKMATIELYGQEVIPRVRALLEDAATSRDHMTRAGERQRRPARV